MTELYSNVISRCYTSYDKLQSLRLILEIIARGERLRFACFDDDEIVCGNSTDEQLYPLPLVRDKYSIIHD